MSTTPLKSLNIQRYAYSPLVDDVSDDEDAEATTKSSVALTVKKRGGDQGQTHVDNDEKMVRKKLWL